MATKDNYTKSLRFSVETDAKLEAFVKDYRSIYNEDFNKTFNQIV